MHQKLSKALLPVVLLMVFGGGWAGCGDRSHDAASSNRGSSEVGSTRSDRCEENENPFEQISCYVRVAEEAQDPEVCAEAVDSGVRLQCFAILAERMDRLELCDRITGASPDELNLKDLCVSDVALVRLEPELCARLKSQGLRDSCYMKIFRKNKDATLCERIRDIGLKSLCEAEPVTPS